MASGIVFDDEGNDITMDVLSEAVETMPDPPKVSETWILGAHVRALASLLEKTGDITPTGRHLVEQAVEEHLPTVVWEDHR